MNKKDNQRVRLTKKLLKDSLVQLMKEKPFYQITVTDVCRVSELNRSTFYKHYSNVHDILLELENEVIESTKACIDEIDKMAVNSASQPLTKFLRHIKANSESYLILLNRAVDDQFRSSLMALTIELIGDKFEYGEVIENSDERLTYLMHGSIALIDKWLESGTVLSAEELTDMLLKFAFAVSRC